MNRILIVDDEEEIVKSLFELLKSDYVVYTALSGEAGLKIVTSTELHVVIADQRMPGMSGTEFLTHVKELAPTTIRILLTGYADVDAIIQAINEGQIYKYVAKPWYPEALQRELSEACEHYNIMLENNRLTHHLNELNLKLEQKVQESTKELIETREVQRQTEIRYQQLFNTASEGFIILDQTGTVIDANPAMLNILAVKSPAVIGKKFWRINGIRATSIQRLLRNFNKLLRAPEVTIVQSTLKLTNDANKEFILDYQGHLVKTEGHSDLIFGVIRDITNYKKAEMALKESEQKFRSLAENSLQGIFIFQNMQFVYLNNMIGQITGLPSETMLKMNLEELVAKFKPKPEPFIQDCLQAIQQHRDLADHFEVSITHHNGQEIWLEISKREISFQGEIAWQGAIVDISERKQHEKEREQLLHKLSNQNAELERFVYTVSHDLKTPLVTLKGFAGLLEEDLKQGNQKNIENDLYYIHRACNKMQKLIQDLLELSRIGRVVNPDEEVEFEVILQEALEQVQALAQKSNVQFQLHPPFGKVKIDRQRVVEALINLLTNAIKFMGDNAQPVIEIGKEHLGSETYFYVKDNGIGIHPKYHQKIFNLFEQIKMIDVEGTGVGLTIVKRIIELHGGRIWVISEVGKGSTFCFTLGAVVEPERHATAVGTDV
ncbi:PAS domain S-box protein [candidate division KSB1 bacterium]|nr:PAS domain S-box protein [candidate division KSB1 bacterium]